MKLNFLKKRALSAIIILFSPSILLADIRIKLGKLILMVEIANTYESRKLGLMGRDVLEEGHGMLFIYEEPSILSFWMKNTLIPLSIGFFDQNRCLVSIADMYPPKGNSYPTTKSHKPALYALEVPLGWFVRNQIEMGTEFSFLDPENEVD